MTLFFIFIVFCGVKYGGLPHDKYLGSIYGGLLMHMPNVGVMLYIPVLGERFPKLLILKY